MKPQNRQMIDSVRRGAALMAELCRSFGILSLIVAATAMVLMAQDEQLSKSAVKFTTLFSFDGTDGDGATGSLAQGTDGDF